VASGVFEAANKLIDSGHQSIRFQAVEFEQTELPNEGKALDPVEPLSQSHAAPPAPSTKLDFASTFQDTRIEVGHVDQNLATKSSKPLATKSCVDQSVA